jgi:hypothetical protein
MSKKKFEDAETFTFRASKKMIDNLKTIAMSFTKQEGKLYTASDLIRDTMNQIFPIPKQLNLFKSDKEENERIKHAIKTEISKKGRN